MPKIVKELSAVEVNRLKEKPGFHSVGGVSGLHLQVKRTKDGKISNSCSWILRVQVGNRRPDIGLGPYPEVSLAEARAEAKEIKKQVREGIDPIAERKARKSALIQSQAKLITFEKLAQEYLAKKGKEFKTTAQIDRLTNQMKAYAYPVIGSMVVSDIERIHILNIIEPIWIEKNETAGRVRMHIERILDLAEVKGLRDGSNPARWAGNLSLSLPARKKVAKVQHRKSLPYKQLPEFMAQLKTVNRMGAKALSFIILTCARYGEACKGTWDEIDFEEQVWTIPGGREGMKLDEDHKVPLTDAALNVLADTPRLSDYIFSNNLNGPLSDVSVSKIPKLLGHDVTTHGMRATFRTWAQECTDYPEEVIEQCLSHTFGSAVRNAYARSKLMDKRRALLEEWAAFCLGVEKSEQPPMGEVKQING